MRRPSPFHPEQGEREPQVFSLIGILEVRGDEGPDMLEPVEHGRPVYAQRLGRPEKVHVVCEVGLERGVEVDFPSPVSLEPQYVGMAEMPCPKPCRALLEEKPQCMVLEPVYAEPLPARVLAFSVPQGDGCLDVVLGCHEDILEDAAESDGESRHG